MTRDQHALYPRTLIRVTRRVRMFSQVLAVLLLLSLNLARSQTTSELDLSTNVTTISNSVLHPVYGVGSWIWADKTYDQQTCRLWRAFKIPRAAVKHAQLNLTADNSYRLFLDGREVGRGGEWRGIGQYDLTWVLSPGVHVLAIEAFNDWSA